MSVGFKQYIWVYILISTQEEAKNKSFHLRESLKVELLQTTTKERTVAYVAVH